MSAKSVAAVFIPILAAMATAQKPSAEDVNKANNPLTPAITVNLQQRHPRAHPQHAVAQPLLPDFWLAKER
jgi:hypothetical protein